MKHKKSVLKILSANSECFRVSAGIAPNEQGLAMVWGLEIVSPNKCQTINNSTNNN